MFVTIFINGKQGLGVLGWLGRDGSTFACQAAAPLLGGLQHWSIQTTQLAHMAPSSRGPSPDNSLGWLNGRIGSAATAHDAFLRPICSCADDLAKQLASRAGGKIIYGSAARR